MTPCMKWLLRAGPSDYMLALSVASASLPVVGKRLPLGWAPYSAVRLRRR